MSDYYNILTNLGRSKITDLITSDTALENIQIAFGDGNGSVPTPNPARTALVNEVHRRPANKLQKHPTLTNSIIVDVVIPNNVGGFWIREFGIYFDGVLICNGSLAPTFKEASDDTVNTYRLKPYINVESDRLKVVEIESDLINATESWTQENFINRSEIVDNLTTNDANKVASAGTVKELQDNKLDKTDLKDASTEQKGVVQVNNTLTSTSTTEALTAAQGKELSDNKLNSVSGVATGLKLANSAIREVTGSNYTITYNDSNRIAIIRMRVFTNKTVDGSGVFTVDEGGGYYKALITLPITLQKRISADFLLAAASGSASWLNEAGEWLVQCDPIGSNGVTESKVGVHLTVWRGSAREEVDGYLEVVGIF